MDMFPNFLDTLPKNRHLTVEELEIPEVSLSPYLWTPPEDTLSMQSDSIATSSAECEAATSSTDSSMPLSRAMTDSEIDYERYRRYKNRSFSDPWDGMRAALDAFPQDYLASLQRFRYSPTDLTEEPTTLEPVHRYDEELRLKMERFLEEECRVFTPDDPSLLTLEDALQSLDFKAIESEFDSLGI